MPNSVDPETVRLAPAPERDIATERAEYILAVREYEQSGKQGEPPVSPQPDAPGWARGWGRGQSWTVRSGQPRSAWSASAAVAGSEGRRPDVTACTTAAWSFSTWSA